MGEIVLSAVITKATEAAGNLLLEKWSNLNSLEESMNWLKTEMKLIQSYIIDARTKLTQGDSRVKNLIKYIEQLADDADDILDEFLPKIERKGTIGCRVSNVSSANKFVAEIEKIKRRVAEIDRLRTTYGITDTSNNNNQHDYIPLDQRGLFLHADETEVIGLDDDFNMLQAKLLDHDLPYGVVSIVGMPGLGKTTLAKKLFRHVRDQFECSGLVYVSQQPRAGEILHDIAKQVGLTEEERKENLEGNLRSLLKRKRHDAEKMDLSGDGDGDSFPQLEILHIEDARGLSEVMCMDDMSMPKLKKLLLVQGPIIYSPISLRVSERLAMLRI